MKKNLRNLCYTVTLLLLSSFYSFSQQGASMYGDKADADVKMNYVYTIEDAFEQAREQNKPIFFNCFADWAVPCHGMNKVVFSDKEFADYMNENFINLFMDVSTRDALPIVDKYNIRYFAHFLILDVDDNILLRIVGGQALPEFKESVMLALDPKTNLPGTEAKYNSGKYNKEDLLNYLAVLHLASDDEKFKEVSKEYFAMLKPNEYSKKENWRIISNLISDRESDLYKHLIANIEEYKKNIGEKQINMFIESFFYSDMYYYAVGSETYDEVEVSDLHKEMQEIGLPDSLSTFKLYDIAKLRGDKKYDELLKYMKAHADKLGQARPQIEMSFEFPDMSDKVRENVVSYLRASAKEQGGSSAKQLEAFASKLANKVGEGIIFEEGSFKDALAKAKKENKLLFIDCYTTWCGPCRFMSNQVFVHPKVGEYFNENFVNIKIDMEAGEGIDLAKEYNILAYPTMMLLDGDGSIVQRIGGARGVRDMMRIAIEGANPETGYTASKQAYESGDRSGVVIKGYTNALRESGELNEAQIEKIISDFFVGLDDEQYCDKRNWPLIEANVKDVKGKEFAKILELHDELANENTVEVVNRKIESVVFPYVLRHFNYEVSENEVMEVLSPISSGRYPKYYTLNVLAKLVPMFNDKSADKVLDFYEKEVTQIENMRDRLNIDMIFHYFFKEANAEQISRAKVYVENILEDSTDEVSGKYRALLEVLNEIKPKTNA